MTERAAKGETVEVRLAFERLLHGRIVRCITSASRDARTVESPDTAAQYVTNSLLHHTEGQELLAALAIAFASDHLLTAGWVPDDQ